MAVIEPRQFGYRCGYNQYYDNRYGCVNRSTWDWWGRWVLLGILILVFLIIVPLFCCVTARRRRKRGLTPMYGSGWMARNTTQAGHYQNNPQGYNNYGNNNYQPPPPQYAQQTGQTYNSNEGYYGAGVQAPGNAYTGNREVGNDYAPPPGPPPAKAG